MYGLGVMNGSLDFPFGKLGDHGTPIVHVGDKLVIYTLVERII